MSRWSGVVAPALAVALLALPASGSAEGPYTQPQPRRPTPAQPTVPLASGILPLRLQPPAQYAPFTDRGSIPHLAGAVTPMAYTAHAVEAALQQGQRTRRWEGAAVGLVAGALVTHFVLYSGGSTSLCDREQNQDAMRRGECTALVAAGGLLGAGAGYFVGSRIRVGGR